MRRTRRKRGKAEFAATVTGLALGVSSAVTAAGMGVLAAVMARTIVTPPRTREENVLIRGVDLEARTVTLSLTPDSVLDGEYSLWFSDDTGHARLGEVLFRDAESVTRRILEVDFGDLPRARRGRLGGWLFLGPWSLGVPYENVLIDSPVGPAPAWFIPAAESTGRWVIQVHGRAVRRQEGLRVVPVFRDAGFDSLLVSYRTDGDAPDDPSGRYGLGDTEWEDVDAAIRYALDHGAQSIVLFGWSMGGAISMQTVLRSEHAQAVAGIILESPVIDWNDVIAFQGAARRLPPGIAARAIRVMASRWGGVVTGLRTPIDFRRLDLIARAGELTVPILLLHSDDDGYVPATGSRRLAELRPDIITFVPYSVARHTKLWNYDPHGFTRHVTEWLARLD
ncbi:MAG TPA: alpha/beta fold hydrolase [Glaciibacter sp.]|nr:alpha/beta fold hydrolase [Glaciibacter sp.]